MKDASTGTFRSPKVTGLSPKSDEPEFVRLCALIDETNFQRSPYKGILGRVAEELGYKGGRRSLHKAIRHSRNLTAMLAVAEAIMKVRSTLGEVVKRLEE